MAATAAHLTCIFKSVRVALLIAAAIACSSCREVLGLDDPVLARADAGREVDGANGAGDTPSASLCADATLVACYEFENTVADGSPHHLDPDVATNVSYAPGEVGQALVVGTATEVDVADSPLFDVTQYTIEAWIQVSQLPDSSSRAGVLDCDQQYGMFVLPAGTLSCNANQVSISAGQVVPGTWTHVACTDDGTEVRAYVGGVLVGELPESGIGSSGTTGITLGGNNPPGGGQPLDGLLDELRLFSVVRSASQICSDAGGTSC